MVWKRRIDRNATMPCIDFQIKIDSRTVAYIYTYRYDYTGTFSHSITQLQNAWYTYHLKSQMNAQTSSAETLGTSLELSMIAERPSVSIHVGAIDEAASSRRVAGTDWRLVFLEISDICIDSTWTNIFGRTDVLRRRDFCWRMGAG